MNFSIILATIVSVLGTAQSVTNSKKMPYYFEMANFYYYDEIRKINPLPLQKKVYVFNGKDTKKWLVDKKIEDISFNHKPFAIDGNKGVLAEFTDNRKTIAAMESLHQAKIFYLPVVKFDTMDCVPSNIIIIKTKPAITFNMLKEKLEKDYRLKFNSIEIVSESLYVVHGIDGNNNPPNTIALAALISEDTSWFENCRPHFIPLHDFVEAYLTIQNPASADLSYKRILKLTIKSFHKDAKVKKDLLPVLGKGDWNPNANVGFPKEEVWYDFDEPQIKEYTHSGITTIEVTYPFTFLYNDIVAINGVKIPYVLNGQEKFCLAGGIKYGVSSFLNGSGIEDLQPITPVALQQVDGMPNEVYSNQSWWFSGGWLAVVTGGLLFLLGICGIVAKVMSGYSSIATMRKDKLIVLNALKEAANRLHRTKNNNWRDVYFATNGLLRDVLIEVYNKPLPLSSADVDDDLLYDILAEIEKAYAENTKPQIKLLADSLRSFVKKSYSHV